MRKRFLAFLVIIVIALSGCSQMAEEKSTGISGYTDTVLNPFMREPDSYYSESKLSMQENGLDYTNYWIQTVIALTEMRLNKDYEYAASVIDREIDSFERYGYFPRPAYQSFEYGWVSCMDAPVIALASLWLYDGTGEEKYLDFTRKLSDYILHDTASHGFVGSSMGKRWILEYADVSTVEETSLFVLNGSLLGTLATAIVADATENAELDRLVQEQIENYKNHTDLFLYREQAWCYYELNERRVDPPHYIIYEIRLLDALYEVTKDAWFNEQAEVRRDILLTYYQGFLRDGELYFLRAGAPHYYYIDVFDTVLRFMDEKNEEIGVLSATGTEIPDSIMGGYRLPEGTDHIDWIVHTDFYDVYIGTIEVSEISEGTDRAKIKCSFIASNDGTIEDRLLTIVHDTGRANLLGTFSEPLTVEWNDIFVLELENESNKALTLNIVLYDSCGNTVSRYLPQLQPGKNAIPFSLPGFVEEESALTDINNFNMRIYSNGEDLNPIEIQTGDFYRFDDAGGYILYLLETDYVPAWQ